MNCRLCTRPIPDDAAYCCYCGKKQAAPTRKPKKRGNGEGTVYQISNGTWQCEIRRPVRKTKGGFKTKRDALECLATMKMERATRYDGLTFAKLYDKWSAFYEPRIKSMAAHKAAYAHFVPIHDIVFSELNAEDFQECVDDCDRGIRTRENMKSLASLMSKYAITLRVVDHNYAQYIYCGKNDERRRVGFSADEIEKIKKAVGKVPYADYIYCMIYTGFRPNEMFQLTVDRYDSKQKMLIGGFKTEAGTDRLVPVSPKIANIVKSQVVKACPYIFPRDDGSMMTDKYFRDNYFYPILAQLGIQPMHEAGTPSKYVPYSCRHTFMDLMKSVEGADVDKAALAGHTDYGMTKQYQSADLKSLRRIIDAI